MSKFNLFSVLFVNFLAIGCANKSLYYWGNYESVVYKSFSKPGEMPSERQIEIFLADFERAQAANMAMPPGWHANLGVLYFETGQLDLAHKQLTTEKKLFPESKVFVDNLLKKLVKK